MNRTVMITGQREVEVDPKLLAEIFWNMGDDEQADFFANLAAVVAKHNENEVKPFAYNHGEYQWCCMSRRIKERGKDAWNCYLAFCAFAYDWFKPRDEWY